MAVGWAAKPKEDLIQEIARLQSKLQNETASTDLPVASHQNVEQIVKAQAIMEGEIRFRALVENVPDAFVLHDTDGNIVMVNQALSEALGYSKKELLKLKVHDIEVGVSPQDLDAVWHSMTDPKTLNGRHRRKDGTEFPVEVRVSRFGTPDNPLFLALARDLTERQNIEKALIMARDRAEHANRAKSEFLANMSHELRTPLNSIIGFSEVMRSETFGPLGSRQYLEYITDIHRSGSHLLEVINDILDMSKIESQQVDLEEEAVDVRKLIRDCKRMVEQPAYDAGLKISSRVDPDLYKIRADKRRLAQILINLLSNAIKFTEPKGRIRITCGLNAVGEVVFKVKDSGIGIAEEDIAHIFEPFTQIRSHSTQTHQGTGLGLSLVRALTRLQGGTVDIESAVGKGTTVTVKLPPERVLKK